MQLLKKSDLVHLTNELGEILENLFIEDTTTIEHKSKLLVWKKHLNLYLVEKTYRMPSLKKIKKSVNNYSFKKIGRSQKWLRRQVKLLMERNLKYTIGTEVLNNLH